MKNRFKYLLSLITVLLIISSCHFNYGSVSFRDPDFKNKKYGRICVLALAQDLFMRKSIEDGLVDFLAETGIEVVPGVEILLPTRQHSDDQVRELMKARNMEAVLIVSALGQSPEHEGPGSDMDPGSNNRFGLLSGPGYTIQNYGSALKSDLIDVESGRVAWVCTTKRITEGSDKLAPIVMFCLDVKNRLEEDRILK